MNTRAEWEQYNLQGERKDSRVAVLKKDKSIHPAISYSHDFFREHKLAKLLNSDCKRMLQLGAADGKFIEEHQRAGWAVIGYDFSSVAVKALGKKGIEAKQIDLNSREAGGLTYISELKKDISSPVNILIIRVLQYLELPALNLLLINLIEESAPGSVFFIAGNIDKNHARGVSPETPRYKASFFGPRIDMDILVLKEANADDELLVVRKR